MQLYVHANQATQGCDNLRISLAGESENRRLCPQKDKVVTNTANGCLD
jgi:hypothetical protein